MKGMLLNQKICTREELLGIRERAREAGRTVVHCHGCFDIIHPGHIHYLQYARALGDVLVVTVSADSQVNKGVGRPLIPDELRAGSVAALECVDWVYVNPEATAAGLLEELRPDVYVKGKEYEQNRDPRFLAERETVVRHGGRVVFSSGEVIYSSTALIGGLDRAGWFDGEKVKRFRQQYGLTGGMLEGLAGRIRGQRMVVVGDYILDRYHFCEATGVAAEAPVMALREVAAREYDGGAAVIALHLAGLGGRPVLVGGFADDDLSSEARRRLEANGVEVVAIEHRRQVATKHRYLVENQKVLKVDEGHRNPLDSEMEEEVAERIGVVAEGCAGVVFADFGYGLITEGLLGRILGPLREAAPVLTATVSGKQSNLRRFFGVDLLCATEHEARESLHDYTNGLTAVAWNLMSDTSARQLIVTLGKQGLVLCDQHCAGEKDDPWERRLRQEYIPSLVARPVDPLGCGDALLAVGSAALAAGGSAQAAALMGSVGAALQGMELGNPALTLERLLSGLREQSGTACVQQMVS